MSGGLEQATAGRRYAQRPVAAGTLGSFKPARPGPRRFEHLRGSSVSCAIGPFGLFGPISLATTAAGREKGWSRSSAPKPASSFSPGGVALIGISGDAGSGARSPRQPCRSSATTSTTRVPNGPLAHSAAQLAGKAGSIRSGVICLSLTLPHLRSAATRSGPSRRFAPGFPSGVPHSCCAPRPWRCGRVVAVKSTPT